MQESRESLARWGEPAALAGDKPVVAEERPRVSDSPASCQDSLAHCHLLSQLSPQNILVRKTSASSPSQDLIRMKHLVPIRGCSLWFLAVQEGARGAALWCSHQSHLVKIRETITSGGCGDRQGGMFLFCFGITFNSYTDGGRDNLLQLIASPVLGRQMGRTSPK